MKEINKITTAGSGGMKQWVCCLSMMGIRLTVSMENETPDSQCLNEESSGKVAAAVLVN